MVVSDTSALVQNRPASAMNYPQKSTRFHIGIFGNIPNNLCERPAGSQKNRYHRIRSVVPVFYGLSPVILAV